MKKTKKGKEMLQSMNPPPNTEEPPITEEPLFIGDDHTADDNVIGIKRKKKKRKGQSQSGEDDAPPKSNKGTIEYDLMEILQEEKTFNVWFHRQNNSGTRILTLNDKETLATEISKNELSGLVAKQLEKFNDPAEKADLKYCLGARDRAGLVESLMVMGRERDDWPEPCGFKNQEGCFFERLDFDVPETSQRHENFPFINKMLNRMTNAEPFCARVGSLFVPTADRKLAVVLYGKGDSGKTTIFNMLRLLIGERGLAVVDSDLFKQSFGLWPLVDKRLWIGEEISPRFFAENAFKKLTGGGDLQINRKGKDQFNARMKGILFVNSNDAPTPNECTGLRNRLLLCEIQPVPQSERLPVYEVEARMKSELASFVGYCIDAYNAIDGGIIKPDDTSQYDTAVASTTESMDGLFERYFFVHPDAKISPTEFTEGFKAILKDERELAKEAGIDTAKGRLRFTTFIQRRLDISPSDWFKVKNVQGKATRFTYGFKKRTKPGEKEPGTFNLT